ncbi:MAG: OmpA family protein [Thermodesulfobacteriota bacterium]
MKNAEILKDDTTINVVIFSYADTRGNDIYNELLAKKRSISVKKFMVQNGINSKRLITLSRGETSKFAFGDSEDGYQLNRRSHFIPFKAEAEPLTIR